MPEPTANPAQTPEAELDHLRELRVKAVAALSFYQGLAVSQGEEVPVWVTKCEEEVREG